MDHILQLYKYATFKITWNFFYNFLTKCLFFVNPKSSLSVLSINLISTIIQPIQVGHFFIQPILDWPFQINQLPLILGYLAIDQYNAYACNALKAKYSLVQRELLACQLANLIMRENIVATNYEYSFYDNIHAGVEIVATQREHNIVIHIYV